MGRMAAFWVACAVAGAAVSARGDEPLVISPDVMKSFEEYKQRKKPMYFAVSADGMFSWYVYCPERQCDMTQNHRRIVVERCEEAGGTDCRIFAVGDEIQFDYRVGEPAAMTPAKATTCDAAADMPAAAAALVSRLTPLACKDFRSYGHYRHFKAFAAADASSPAGTWGWSYGYEVADDAGRNALAQCEQGRRERSIAAQCRLFAVGDIVVDGMSDAELRRTMAAYRENRDATNADLTAE